MASNQEPEPLSPIDNDLFHCYTRYQLCLLKKSTSLWTCSQEKTAMLNVLDQFESIDGNTLRMVVNQIFENSAQACNSSNTNEASMGYQKEPTTSSTLILENLPSSSGTTIIAKASNSEAAQDGACTSSRMTIRKRRSNSKKLIQMRPIAKKSKTVDPYIEKLKRLISRSNLEELVNLTDHVERSKYVILTRMRRVSTSFKFKVSAGTATYSLHVSNSFGDPRSPLSLCQMNLIAYQFGKLLKQEEGCDPNGKRKKKAESECFHIIKEELNAHGKRLATSAYKYTRYAMNAVKTAENIGVYALFIPEILTPYNLQVTSREKFPVLQSCLDVKCAALKEIARFDRDGNLIMTEMKYSRKHSDKSYRRTKSKFLNSCA